MPDDTSTFSRPESQIYYFDNNGENHFSTKRELSSVFEIDPNDALKG